MAFQKIIKTLFHRRTTDLNEFKALFERFQQILTGNNRVFDIISELEDKLSGDFIFDINYLKAATDELSEEVLLTVSNLNIITENRYPELFSLQSSIHEELKNIVEGKRLPADERYAIDYNDIESDNAEVVGGKNSNLNEIRNRLNMRVPGGFVITTAAYHRFMEFNDLWPQIR
ncbi:MAG: PEP/pyruvate-binding domain-containing protein, partial [bacterium]